MNEVNEFLLFSSFNRYSWATLVDHGPKGPTSVAAGHGMAEVHGHVALAAIYMGH